MQRGKGFLAIEKPMRIKLSGLPLCKAGDWGLQTPEQCFCFRFFSAKPQKNENKKGFGAAPQWEISVSLMRMGSCHRKTPRRMRRQERRRKGEK
jgi:hypothetical protein